MNLNAYLAEKRLKILDELSRGLEPSEGAFDPVILKEARAKGKPQMGSTRLEPTAIHLEFIFPDPRLGSLILAVKLVSPERIVFMPVPEWVVETIWEGEVAGTPQFETDANRLLSAFAAQLEPGANEAHFAPRFQTTRG